MLLEKWLQAHAVRIYHDYKLIRPRMGNKCNDFMPINKVIVSKLL